MKKFCPKSQRCTIGGRWNLHEKLMDIDRQKMDAAIEALPDYFLHLTEFDAVRSDDGGKTWTML